MLWIFTCVFALPLPDGNTPPPTLGRGGDRDFCLFYFLQKPQCPEQGLAQSRLSVNSGGKLMWQMVSHGLRVLPPSDCTVPTPQLASSLPCCTASCASVLPDNGPFPGSPDSSQEMETASECVRPALSPQLARGSGPTVLPSVFHMGDLGQGDAHAPASSSSPSFLCGDSQKWPRLDKSEMVAQLTCSRPSRSIDRGCCSSILCLWDSTCTCVLM